MKIYQLLPLLGILACCSTTWGQDQLQVQPTVMVIMTPNAADNSVGTNPDLSYQMLSNQAPVNTELLLLQAEQQGEINNTVTAGGMVQVDGISTSN